ncbi:unnamed protein product [Caenorhabditis auriculariae]|uniref:Uncharacterized protein n=1 Tax=Caenorhabditis auriculariae TaxID=2777116 RepID=A0A8S1GX13_9PELO|nr:unnamed protein product [Caenorhabditis auriculariae]
MFATKLETPGQFSSRVRVVPAVVDARLTARTAVTSSRGKKEGTRHGACVYDLGGSQAMPPFRAGRRPLVIDPLSTAFLLYIHR